MIVSINQPAYLPWLGYFDRIARSDVHIVLDHVQFEKNSFTNRNKIRTSDGWAWLTVPVRTKGRFGNLAINELTITENNPWARKHWDSIRFAYARAAHFEAHGGFFSDVYGRQWTRLLDLTRETTDYLLQALGIETPLLYSSELAAAGRKDDLILELCRTAGADTYLSGALGRDYLDVEKFREAGIEVLFQDYRHPEYTQAYPGFEPSMAAIDLLFNHGADSLEMLTGNHVPAPV